MDIEKTLKKISDIDDKIFDLEMSIQPNLTDLQDEKVVLQAELNKSIEHEAKSLLRKKDYGCGTANIKTGSHNIKVVVPKYVKWDQKELIRIRKLIVSSGMDYKAYIDEKLSVKENNYKNFPEDIQYVFKDARTVEPGKMKIEITRKI